MSEPRVPVCDYEGSDYQERFWDRGERDYEDAAEAVALRRLLPPSGDFLLELGAGAGRHSARYAGFQRIALLDYSVSQLRLARDRLRPHDRYDFVAADVYNLPFAQGTFDSATMIRTFHHLARPEAALRSVRRVLRHRASFILEYANKRNLKAIGRWIGRRQGWNPFDREPVELVELNFNFHPHAVGTWLVRAGFQVKRQLAVSYFRVPLLKRLVPMRLLVAADSLLQPSAALATVSPSVFVKAEARTAFGE